MKSMLHAVNNTQLKRMITLALLSSLLACCSLNETEPTPEALFQEKPTHFWTAKEAYQQILPSLTTWQEDAIIVSISSSSSHGENWRIQSDGRSAYWSFAIHSAKSESQTSIYLVDDQIIVGIDLQPGYDKPLSAVGQELNFPSILDSTQILPIAIAGGVPENYTAVAMYYRIHPQKPYPLAWTIRFVADSDPYDSYFIVLDPTTGETIRNDFLPSAE